MNGFIEKPENRRSIRSFKPDMPVGEDIRQIVGVGLSAPSGTNRQTTVTPVGRNKEKRGRIAEGRESLAG